MPGSSGLSNHNCERKRRPRGCSSEGSFVIRVLLAGSAHPTDALESGIMGQSSIRKWASIFAWSHFRTENRVPLFLKMLQNLTNDDPTPDAARRLLQSDRPPRGVVA